MSRDTHFEGFAKALYEELQHEDTKARDIRLPYNHMEVQRKIMAQRAYDLVAHILDRLGTYDNLERLPDLTELPQESHFMPRNTFQ